MPWLKRKEMKVSLQVVRVQVMSPEQRWAELRRLQRHHLLAGQAGLKGVVLSAQRGNSSSCRQHAGPLPTPHTALQTRFFYLFPQWHGLCDVCYFR